MTLLDKEVTYIWSASWIMDGTGEEKFSFSIDNERSTVVSDSFLAFLVASRNNSEDGKEGKRKKFED